MSSQDAETWPLEAGHFAKPLEQLRHGEPWKEVLEELLLDLPEERADRLMQLMREARGAWLPLAHVRAGRALVVGNALSGTCVPLARAGFRVIVLDTSLPRLALARFRDQALAAGRVLALCADAGASLPFADMSFDLVAQEDRLPRSEPDWRRGLDELRRVCRGELMLSADNRFGYKRSSGRRGRFLIPSPLQFLRAGIHPRAGERSLRGYRKLLRSPGFSEPRAFSLYPHSREFTHLVALDAELPRLVLGPKERANRLKLLGHRLGLFPWLTPSFGLFGARSQAALDSPRLDRVLAELARRIDEEQPQAEQVLATRGNSIVVQTRLAGGDPDEPRGRWTLHVPLSPQQQRLLETHHARLDLISARMPGVPVPAGLFLGEIEGLFLGCERRLGGLTGPHLSGDQECARNTFSDAARQTAAWITQPARPLDEADFERLIGTRFDLVASKAAVEATRSNLRRLREESAELLIGRSFPRVLYHADLRSKHVQMRPDGHVIGYLDWGPSETDDLPYYDLLHLICHERKQEADLRAEEAWAIVREGERLRDYERAALEDYAGRLGLDPLYCRAIERIYPVLVAATVERNWDYSRPRWLHREFGL